MIEEVYTSLKRKVTLTLAILYFIMVLVEFVVVVDVDIGIKIPANVPLIIMDKELTFMEELDIGLIPATLTPITQMAVIYFWMSLLLLFLLTKMFTMTRE